MSGFTDWIFIVIAFSALTAILIFIGKDKPKSKTLVCYVGNKEEIFRATSAHIVFKNGVFYVGDTIVTGNCVMTAAK